MSKLSPDDRGAITEILSLHGHLFDSGRLDRLAEIFAPEVVYDVVDLGMGTHVGIDAIRRGATLLGDRNPIAHHVTNVVIADEEHGEVTVKSKGLIIRSDGTVASVDHLDTLVRHEGDWRISRRVITARRAPMDRPHAAHVRGG